MFCHHCVLQPSRAKLLDPWHSGLSRLDKLKGSIKTLLPPTWLPTQHAGFLTRLGMVVTSAWLAGKHPMIEAAKIYEVSFWALNHGCMI